MDLQVIRHAPYLATFFLKDDGDDWSSQFPMKVTFASKLSKRGVRAQERKDEVNLSSVAAMSRLNPTQIPNTSNIAK